MTMNALFRRQTSSAGSFFRRNETKTRSPLKRFVTLLACAILMPASVAFGQDYPSKPIRIVVGFPPGGIMDIYGRGLAKLLQEKLKNPVVIDNRPGAGGLVGADVVVKSAPDGYTLTHIVPSTVTSVFLKDPPFDIFKAMQPIASVWTGPFVLSVTTQTGAQTLKEFVDLAKANPGKLNFASSNGPNFLPMVLFNSLAGIQLQSIEYKGATQMHTAMLANEVQATLNTVQSILPYLSGGKIRVLAVTGDQRLATMPNVPTMAELGYPRMQLHTVGAVMAPAGVPAAVATKLGLAFKEIVGSAEMEKLLRDNGRPLIVGTDELMKLMREEVAAWEAAAKVAGFKPQ